MSEYIPQETISRIKQLRVNALFGKKKHFNAADRKQRYMSRLGSAVIIINAILGSGLFFLLRAETAEIIKWVGAALSLTAALCAAPQRFFGWQRVITGHRNIASRYLEVSHDCKNLLADFKDGQINFAQLGKRRDTIQKTLSRIDAEAQSYPTSDADYKQAKRGLANGEESYTEAELQLGDGP